MSTFAQVSTLERRLKRDAAYKSALKQRTEIAEQAAEKRWSEAESKIPVLESQITKLNDRCVASINLVSIKCLMFVAHV